MLNGLGGVLLRVQISQDRPGIRYVLRQLRSLYKAPRGFVYVQPYPNRLKLAYGPFLDVYGDCGS